jgi:hypothetical protein
MIFVTVIPDTSRQNPLFRIPADNLWAFLYNKIYITVIVAISFSAGPMRSFLSDEATVLHEARRRGDKILPLRGKGELTVLVNY